MNIEEYKELMKFNLLMSSIDLSIYNYAAVDNNGDLWCYTKEPTREDDLEFWVADEGNSGTEIENITPPKNWKETLIEL